MTSNHKILYTHELSKVSNYSFSILVLNSTVIYYLIGRIASVM